MTQVASPTQDNELRDRILSAARRIFLDGAPEAATMDAVAQTAGMSKKTIYREFKSQLELLAALMEESAADLGPIPPPDEARDFEEQLTGLVTRLMKHVMAPRSMSLIRLIISEIRRYPELLKLKNDRGYPVMVIAQWLAHEPIRKRYNIQDPEDAAAMLLGMVTQDASFKLILIPTDRLPDTELERRARTGVAIFLRGLERLA